MSEEFNNIEEIKKFLNNFGLIDYAIEYTQDNENSFLEFYNNKYNLLNYDILKNKDIKNANIFERSLIEDKLINNKLLKYLSKGYNLGIVEKKNTFYNFMGVCVDFEIYYGDEEEKINKYINMIANNLDQLYILICDEVRKRLNFLKKEYMEKR